MTFQRIFDYDLARRIMTHPKVYPWITDDTSPAPGDFRPVESDALWYVVAIENVTNVLGLFLLVPQNSICWEVHTCMLPAAWGPKAIQAARELPAWLAQRSPCRRIVTNVPAYNRLALRFAMRAGMTEFGRNQMSYLKGGKVYDQIMLGLTVEEPDSLSLCA